MSPTLLAFSVVMCLLAVTELREAAATVVPGLRWFSPGAGGMSTITSSGVVYSAVHGLLFVGSDDGRLLARNASSGAVVFTFETRGSIRATPVLSRDPAQSLVFVGSRDGSFYAVRAADGAEQWRFATTRFIDTTAVVTQSGIVIFGGTTNYQVNALNATTGALLWSWVSPRRGEFLVGFHLSKGEAAVYVGDALHTLAALAVAPDAPTREIWSRRLPNSVLSEPRLLPDPRIAQPRSSDVCIGVGEDSGTLFILDAQTGGVLAEKQLGFGRIQSAVAPLTTPDTASAEEKDNLWAPTPLLLTTQRGVAARVDLVPSGASATPPTLQLVWTFDLRPTTIGNNLLAQTPAAAKRALPPEARGELGPLPEQLFIAANSRGSLFCFDPGSGDVLFELTIGAGISRNHPLLVPEERDALIFTTTAGDMYAVDLVEALRAAPGARANAAGSLTGTPAPPERPPVGAGTIVGVSVGAVLLLVAVVGALYCFASRRSHHRRSERVGVPGTAAPALGVRPPARAPPPPAPLLVDPSRGARTAASEFAQREQRIFEADEVFPPHDGAVTRDSTRTSDPSSSSGGGGGDGNETIEMHAAGAVSEEQLGTWRELFCRAVLGDTASDEPLVVKLDWLYVRRLTREFADPAFASGVSTRRSACLFHAEESIDGVRRAFAVRLVDLASTSSSHNWDDAVTALSRIRHPNIIPFVAWAAVDEPGGACHRAALVMPSVGVATLADILARPERCGGPIAALHGLTIALTTARALAHAHLKGVLHGDVASESIVLDSDGNAFLTSFALVPAVARAAGACSPPVTRARGLVCPAFSQGRCDFGRAQEVFAFSVVLLELLRGAPMGSERDLPSRAANCRVGPALTQEQQLLQLCARGTDPDPSSRPLLAEFVQGLQAALAVAAAGPPPPAPRLRIVGAEDDSGNATVCAVCWEPAGAAGAAGVECSAHRRDFFCRECLNTRVAALLDDADATAADLLRLQCPMPSCAGQWFFSDVAPLLAPRHLRAWHERSVALARIAGRDGALEFQGSVDQPWAVEVHRHAGEIRRLLRPACPRCALPFASFSGCATVTCGVAGARGAAAGCRVKFCGACMQLLPCARRCGHAILTHGELHERWRVWRRARVTAYLGQLPGDPVLRRDVLAMAQMDLEACGVWPLVAPG